MSGQWHLVSNGEKFGPYSFDQLKDFADSGSLAPSDILMEDGAQSPVAAASIPHLFSTTALTARPPTLRSGSPTYLSGADEPDTDEDDLDISHAAARPPLWNPNVAAGWSLLFTPIFGAFLHAANWRTLGKPDRARMNTVWLLATVAFLAINLGTMFLPESKGVDGIMRFGGLLLLLGWYYTQGKIQAGYVRDELPHGYVKKPWGTPIAIALGGLVGYVALAGGLAVAFDPGGNFGELLSFNNGELFYTDKVTKAEAQRLGEYLVQQQYFNGNHVSVQLNRQGNAYEVRLVTIPGSEKDLRLIENMRQFASEISRDVFGSAPVQIHLCDAEFKTVRVVAPK